jgi:hypothetical protein
MDLKWSSFLREGLFKVSFKESNVAFVFLATLFVLFFIGSFFILGSERIERMEKQISLLEKKTKNLVTSVKKKEQFLEEYKKCDPDFLKNTIGSLVFLKKDQEVLSRIKDETYLPIKERFAYLTGGDNRLKFINTTTRDLQEYKEKEWALDHPVELNKKDLMILLSSIEGNASFKPQLIIKKIDLKCEREKPLFSLDLEILQRGPSDGV